MTPEEQQDSRSYYFSTRDLLTIAVFSGIGGVLSTYIGYLGNMLNRMLGVPFGAGQFVAGLHVFWLMFIAGLLRRPGAATLAGLLKGVVELLTGSTHGIAIVLVSLVQGALVDAVLVLFRRHDLLSFAVAGGVATAANVFVFQILYFSGAPITYILLIAGLALVSGMLLAGYFSAQLLNLVQQFRPLGAGGKVSSFGTNWVQAVISILLVIALAGGAIYYYAVVFEPPWMGPEGRVEGAVETPITFTLSDFSDDVVTISAELEGDVTHVPEKEYTSVPVPVILEKTTPVPSAETLRVVASDGYEVEFSLAEVMADDKFILIEEEDTLRLIAGNYEGGYWVKQVARLVVD
jgi:energy-coupling factor transport system substrate-specific component